MSLTIIEQNLSSTDKGFRCDIEMQNYSFWNGDTTSTKFRFMGAGDLDESLIPEIAKEVINGFDEWKQGKRSHTLPLTVIRSTAIITSHETIS